MHPAAEYFASFGSGWGRLQAFSSNETPDEGALRSYKFQGFPERLPEETKDGVQWELAKAWEEELEKLHVMRPRTIKGIEQVADIEAILHAILPWRLNNSDMIRMHSDKALMEFRDKDEKSLVKVLEHLGY